MSDIYESDKLLSEYLLFHFGGADEILTNNRAWPQGMREALDFAVRTPRHFASGHVSRALDLGCAVGRSAFEMANNADEVIGIDFSQAFIAAAESLRQGGTLTYRRLEEAGLSTPLTAHLGPEVPAHKLRFLQGDAMNLPEDLGSFDRVHAANLICRLPEPQRLLDRLPQLVRAGGELVLATPCTWLGEFTPPENWPKNGTLPWLEESLKPHFRLVRQAEEPFLIRETARKFQWTTSLVTVWERGDSGV